MEKLSKQYLEQAQEVLLIEAKALTELANQIDWHFYAVVTEILSCKGHLVVTGMGKSGHIAKKIAATLASTGTPSFFIHPAEAAHGDLGMIIKSDMLLTLSNSGESDEIVALLPALKRKGIKIISMTSREDSTLARESDFHLLVKVSQEACPLGLAPTASTTAALGLGDALAVVLLRAREFTPEDFAMSHPAGSLGKRLLIRVSDVMHQGENLPVITLGASLKEALVIMSAKGLGMIAVVDQQGVLQGVFTDGDLRRLFQRVDYFTHLSIDEVMGKNPKMIVDTKLASEALYVMQESRVNGLLVVDQQNKLIGALNMHDLLKAGIV